MNRAADSVDAVIDRGLKAVEDENLERAEMALEEAQRLVGENHVRVLHLNGLIAWAEGRLENAAGYLQKKVAQRIDTRYTPRLRFELDQGVKHSIEVARILNEVLPDEGEETGSGDTAAGETPPRDAAPPAAPDDPL